MRGSEGVRGRVERAGGVAILGNKIGQIHPNTMATSDARYISGYILYLGIIPGPKGLYSLPFTR